jgi:hypothetical protein
MEVKQDFSSMTSFTDKIRAKVERHRKLRQNPRVRSVLAFLITKGLLFSNESFGKAPGSLKLSDFLYTAEHYEPRVYAVLPAVMIHFKNSITGHDAMPATLRKIIYGIEKHKNLDLEYKGIPFEEMRIWASMPLKDKRVKPVGEKKIVKTFRLTPKAVHKLERIASEQSKEVTQVLEELINES